MKGKHIVILLDNARVHTHQSVLSLAEEYDVTLLFNAEYSPHLNPVEQLFGLLKRLIKQKTILTKYKRLANLIEKT